MYHENIEMNKHYKNVPFFKAKRKKKHASHIAYERLSGNCVILELFSVSFIRKTYAYIERTI